MSISLLEITARKFNIIFEKFKTHTALILKGSLIGILRQSGFNSYYITSGEKRFSINSYSEESYILSIFRAISVVSNDLLGNLTTYLVYILGISSYSRKSNMLIIETSKGSKFKIWKKDDRLTVRFRDKTKPFSLEEFESYLERNIKYFL